MKARIITATLCAAAVAFFLGVQGPASALPDPYKTTVDCNPAGGFDACAAAAGAALDVRAVTWWKFFDQRPVTFPGANRMKIGDTPYFLTVDYGHHVTKDSCVVGYTCDSTSGLSSDISATIRSNDDQTTIIGHVTFYKGHQMTGQNEEYVCFGGPKDNSFGLANACGPDGPCSTKQSNCRVRRF